VPQGGISVLSETIGEKRSTIEGEAKKYFDDVVAQRLCVV
jgi:hypothetical protein